MKQQLNEVKRMQKLAGVISEAEKQRDYEVDLYSADTITLNGEELDVDKLEDDNQDYRNFILDQEEKAFMYKGKPATIYSIDLNDGSVDEPKISITTFG